MYKGHKIGIGVTTYDRPDFLQVALRSVTDNLLDVADVIVVHDDASSDRERVRWIAADTLKPREGQALHIYSRTQNAGVAVAKNYCLEKMIDQDCDFLFLMEDDIKILDERAITRYVDVSLATGIEHLNFAHHGPLNRDSGSYGNEHLLETEILNDVEVFSAGVGAWSFFTRNAIETVGYLDENFYNAWEHLEHTYRMANAGMTFRFWRFPDVKGSDEFITEQENAFNSTVIRRDPNYYQKMEAAKQYWIKKGDHPW